MNERFRVADPMSRSLSLFLDLVRFGAALLVVLHHACFAKFGTHLPIALAKTGTQPVIVFFVLSGFVIAYTAEAKDRTLSDYALSRLSRLLSVVLPALLLTISLDALGRALDPALYADHWTDAATLKNLATPSWVRLATTATFTNEIWWLDLWPGTNSPFWSLGYEFSYYVLFGIAFYLRGAIRVAALILGATVIGPKLLLLLPVWLTGVLAWVMCKRLRPTPRQGFRLMAAALLAYAAFAATGAKSALDAAFAAAYGADAAALSYSAECAGDVVTGLLFAIFVLGFTGVEGVASGLLERHAWLIRQLAAMTFSMYLFHYPLIYFFAALTKSTAPGGAAPIIVLGGSGLSIFFLARFTEARKRDVRQALLWPFDVVRRRAAALDRQASPGD
jgi:peptidoglycan/LPS O-acetylase OafA/YrhL